MAFEKELRVDKVNYSCMNFKCLLDFCIISPLADIKNIYIVCFFFPPCQLHPLIKQLITSTGYYRMVFYPVKLSAFIACCSFIGAVALRSSTSVSF